MSKQSRIEADLRLGNAIEALYDASLDHISKPTVATAAMLDLAKLAYKSAVKDCV